MAEINRKSIHFRFYDNRQKYLLFVNTCSEKWAIANRVGIELPKLQIFPPALRIFDAGLGDGTVLTRVMRHTHKLFPNVPFYIVGKEISLEDIRLTLQKLPDRFYEHPSTVFVVTNMLYSEATTLTPRSAKGKAELNWREIPLTGNSTHDFEEQISGIESDLADGWQVELDEKTGNPKYVKPSVFILYRKDHQVLLDNIIPRPGKISKEYNLIIASQPFRLGAPINLKIKSVLCPLAKSLAPGGRMITIQSYGNDPGMEIIRQIWPNEDPFIHNRFLLLELLRAEITQKDLYFSPGSDAQSLFKYVMHTLPSEVQESIGTSTLMAAWNAAVYVSQIEEGRLEMIMQNPKYLDVTADILKKRRGLWFNDESFIISRRRKK
ncbi:MAG: hypothetical protein VW226_09420 [Rhodospirillaceae bacterium]